MRTLLIVENDQGVREVLSDLMEVILPREEWQIIEVDSYDGADIAIQNAPGVSAAMITFSERGGSEGIPLVRITRDSFPRSTIILIHQYEDDYVEKSVRAGVNALIYKGMIGLKNLTDTFRALKLI